MATEFNDIKSYRWETGYEKSWEEIREDDRIPGLSILSESIASQARKKYQGDKIVRLGMMRHLNVIVDFSESMSDQDLKPNRHICTLNLLKKFITEFLEQNPISQLGVIVTRNKRAEKICEMSGNIRKHIQTLEPCSNPSYCIGEASLQNALELALSSMKSLPSHTSREILVIYGSFTTCDPGKVKDTIDRLSAAGIKSSVIGLGAEVYILKKLSSETGGKYSVVLHDEHFQELLLNYVKPQSVTKNCEATCVKMGFPNNLKKPPPITNCMCHLNESNSLNKTGYYCPQCNSKYCELPIECKTCGITLVTSAHMVRPLKYLIPLPPFKDITDPPKSNSKCYGCQKKFTENEEQLTFCGECKQMYCIHCDQFIHELMYVCPGCATISK